MVATLFAIGWKPEIRGLLFVLIAVVTLCGSIYLILATNLGARLGFLVALTGLAGWMALMGGIWWVYGIGLKGPEPSWKEIPGRTVIQSAPALVQAGVTETPIDIDPNDSFVAQADTVRQHLVDEGWRVVDESEPAFGQASSAAGEFLESEEAFEAGEFQVTDVLETGGDRAPKINDTLDFIAFFHEPHYALAEVAALEPLRDEPGRAPTPPQIDESRQRQYVYMVRDLGARRQPAAAICIGSSIVFLALCWMLNRRERFVTENRQRELVSAG